MLECADVLNTKAAPDLDPVEVRLREAAWASRDRTLSKHPWLYFARAGERAKEAASKLGRAFERPTDKGERAPT